MLATQVLLLSEGNQQERCRLRQGEECVELPLLAANPHARGFEAMGHCPTAGDIHIEFIAPEMFSILR